MQKMWRYGLIGLLLLAFGTMAAFAQDSDTDDDSDLPEDAHLRIVFEDDFETGRFNTRMWNRWETDSEIRIIEYEDGHVVEIVSGENDWPSINNYGDESMVDDYTLTADVMVVSPQSSVFMRGRKQDGIHLDTYLSTYNWAGIAIWEEDDGWFQMNSAQVYLAQNNWHQYRIELEDQTARLYLDERLVTSATNDDIPDTGAFEIGPSPDSTIYIDNVVIRAIETDEANREGLEIATAKSNVNVRRGPGTDNPVVTGLTGGDVVYILDRNEDESWFYIRRETGQPVQGWVSVDFLTSF